VCISTRFKHACIRSCEKGLWIVYLGKINRVFNDYFYRYAQKSGVSGIVSAPEAVRAS